MARMDFRTDTTTEQRQNRFRTPRYFSLIMGLVFLGIGIMGFIPGFLSPHDGTHNLAVDSGYGLLLGLFPVNVLHSAVHVIFGLWGILAYKSYGSSRTYARSVAIIYGILTIMGLIPILNTTFGLVPLYGHDVWLHGAITLVAAYFGFRKTYDRNATVRS